MTCEDCIHYEVCATNSNLMMPVYTSVNMERKCEFFKAKSKYIELPDLKENQALYIIYNNKIKCLNVSSYSIKKGILMISLYRNGFNWYCDVNDIGKTVFLTKEEAERKLKELKEK